MRLFRKEVRGPKEKELSRLLTSCFGITPKDISLYMKALTHRSMVRQEFESNERMEFLGDAVLGLVTGEEVYKRYPKRDEGFLTQMRSRIVSRESLNRIAEQSGLCEFIAVKGAEELPKNASGNMLEAMIGAIYLDLGFEQSRQALHYGLLRHVDWQELECTESDYKSRMVERCQKKHKRIEFRVFPLPAKGTQPAMFKAEVRVDGTVCGVGLGGSKKDAEQEAAHQAWMREFNRFQGTVAF